MKKVLRFIGVAILIAIVAFVMFVDFSTPVHAARACSHTVSCNPTSSGKKPLAYIMCMYGINHDVNGAWLNGNTDVPLTYCNGDEIVIAYSVYESNICSNNSNGGFVAGNIKYQDVSTGQAPKVLPIVFYSCQNGTYGTLRRACIGNGTATAGFEEIQAFFDCCGNNQ